jgi:hypothetical protein
MEAMTAIVFLAYLCTPEHTTVQAAIASRLVVFTMLLGLGWLQMPRWRYGAGVMLVAMATVSMVFGVYVRAEIQRFQRDEIGPGFLSMIDSLPEESRLAVIIEDRRSPTVQVHAHEHMYGYHFALNRGIAYSTFHSYYGRHARWLPGKTIAYPGRQVKGFLRSANVCRFDYVLTRTKVLPRWKRLRERLTYIDHSARYSLWKVETERISLCTKAGEEAPAQSKVAAERRAVTHSKPRTLASTLSPKVGRARGRTLGGAWKRSTTKPARTPKRRTQRDNVEEASPSKAGQEEAP